VEGQNLDRAIAGIEYLSFILYCRNCGHQMGDNYNADSPSAVRKCHNPECIQGRDERQWFDSNTPEFQVMARLRDALRDAKAVAVGAQKTERLAFDIRLELPKKGPYKPRGR
jgi:hypothetical protein